ncbi:MAG: chromosomal replication initiator protein DnaA [Candidatus Symbiothrix sp.]|nr:chromosomal replication initiator protein DnaA [Candidatus Symbiothrix sp.]
MESHLKIWNGCLGIIRDNISESAYSIWFTPIVPLQYAEDDFTIQVPSQFFYEFIEENYADLIYHTLLRITGKKITLNYRIIVDTSNQYTGHTTLQSEHPINSDENQRAAKSLNQAPSPFDSPSVVQDWNPNLNNKLNFNNFFEGSSNEIARSISLKIAEEPGKKFNPFFIYGHSGVGKTHLGQAIGNRVVELHPQKKVLYISAHLFEVQFTDARKKNTHNEFVHFYQDVDVLILDDIHELAGKEKTQQAYFHIFNHLRLIGKQLVITADKPPMDIQGLDERLISRLKWGLTMELQKPDLELRKKILYYRIKQDGLSISDEIVEYIAENTPDHVRDLEGIISSLVAHAVVCNKEIDLDLAKCIVSRTVKIRKKQITIEAIQNVVSSFFSIDADLIHSLSRKREIVQARQVIMYLSKKHTGHSCSHIGSMVGKRDHATVIHAIKAIQDSLDTDKGFNATMKDIEALLLS